MGGSTKLKYPKLTCTLSGEEERSLFVDWLLSDVAERPSCGGKHPAGPMRGASLEYSDPPPNGRNMGLTYMRRSDLAARRYVAILILRDSGRSLEYACAEVANRLDKTTATAKKMKSIGTGFAKFHKRVGVLRDSWLPMFLSGFTDWLNWEIKESLFDNGISLEDYEDCLQQHAEWVFGNHRKAVRFARRHMELALRAVILLGPRIEQERLQ